ncbi:MAG: SpoIIE family protein phosphatase, partial [Bacteroidales bacterium]|nr:SpoIIE family protein phosphatase [Bacteroidales bacterium]
TSNFYEWADSLDDEEVSAIANGMASGESGMGRFMQGWELSFAIYDSLNNGWSAAIVCHYKDVLARTSKLHLILIMIGLIGLLILFIICYFIIRRHTRPLTEFTQSAISIAKGNFQTELPEIKTEDEIRQLRDSFDYMQHSLISYINDLKTTTQQNERFESELNIASNIQQGMLPKDFPHTDTIDLFATLKPAREVGGDLYDFYVKNNYLYFAIGDVSGKGMPASLFMAITRAAFRFISILEPDMAKLMFVLNNALSDNNATGMFVTLFAGRINLETGEMDYCNGGHNPIVVIPAKDKPYYLNAKANLALGIMENFKFEAEHITLEKGTQLLLYTDGVTEAERADKVQYGEQRLLSYLEKQDKAASAETECNSLMDDVHAFVEGNEQNDDITIMTIKI